MTKRTPNLTEAEIYQQSQSDESGELLQSAINMASDQDSEIAQMESDAATDVANAAAITEAEQDEDGSTELVKLDSSMITAEVVDNIIQALGAQDAEIDRTSKLLNLIDARIARYKTFQETVTKLSENAIKKRKEVESAHRAAQMARAMLEVERVTK